MTSLIVLEEQLPVITPGHVLPGSPVLHNPAALYVVDEGFADYQSEVHVLMNHCEYNQSEIHVRAAEKPLCEYYQLLTSHWNYDVV